MICATENELKYIADLCEKMGSLKLDEVMKVEKEGVSLVIQRKGTAHYRLGFDKDTRAPWIAGGTIAEIIHRLNEIDSTDARKVRTYGKKAVMERYGI